MNDDPYSPPDSDLGRPRQRPRESVWWKLFFIFSALLMLLSMLAVTQLPGLALSLFDVIDLGFSLMALVALFGFAYSRPIATPALWRWFFYLALAEGLIYSLLLPAIGQPRYGEVTAYDWWYAVEIGYAVALYCALYLYAFRRSYPRDMG